MHHVTPDPHPGRCSASKPGGYMGMNRRRCLRTEGHDGACRWPDDFKPTAGGNMRVYQQGKPKPWVEPPVVTPTPEVRDE
jgi:hypothetical protein